MSIKEGTEVFIYTIYVNILIFVSCRSKILTNWRHQCVKCGRTSVVQLSLKLKVVRFSCNEFPREENTYVLYNCALNGESRDRASAKTKHRIVSRDLSSPNVAMEVRIMWRPSIIPLRKLERAKAPYHDSWYVSPRLMQW